MSLRAKIGWTVAVLSVVVNGAGAVYALAKGEWMHGGTHAALFALTAYLMLVFRPGARRTPDDASWAGDVPPVSVGDARMEQLQQSVDAIAIEVERLGEARRFNAKLAAQQGEGTGERR
jgi:hypothetical protein